MVYARLLEQYTQDIAKWMKEHAPAYYEDWQGVQGATEEEIEHLEEALNLQLPEEFKVYLQHYGGNDRFHFAEYTSMSTKRIVNRWSSLRELEQQGTFATAEPAEIASDELRVLYTWWNNSWVPFAEDSGGNLMCIDLLPGSKGVVGQVFFWEIHGGPCVPSAVSLLEYIKQYKNNLMAGQYFYDENAGLFSR